MAGKTILVLMMLFGFVQPADDPFTGTWILRPYAAKIPAPFSATKGITIHVTVNASSIEITGEVAKGSDKHLTIHSKAEFDGKDYPITGTPYVDTVAYERVARNKINGLAKKSGKPIMHVTAVLSSDGKSIVSYYSFTDPIEKVVIAVAVFDRK